jgi:hypothetical protein
MLFIWLLVAAAFLAPGVIMVPKLRQMWRPPPDTRHRMLLGFATVSWLWLIGVAAWPELFGPQYSNRRFAAILGNLVVIALALIVSILGKQTRRDALVIFIVLVDWFYLLVVSSIV